ncbi:hypothetical protein QUF63_14500 [Anaerolineales bacterium HSG25]|nr:hypothetical protein [Anaerolineales bacterium HSG25]
MANHSKKDVELSAERQALLHRQLITIDEPGTILKDFNLFLTFIGSDGTPVSGKHDLLPNKTLLLLNEQLSTPYDIHFKRPRQSSYPNLNGLYLLARGSGLTRIGDMDGHSHLLLNETVYEQWQTLNPTEQYFILFEAWLFHSPLEIIGPHSDIWNKAAVAAWRWFFQRMPEEGMQIAGNTDARNQLRYTPKWHNLALLELFGLVLIKPAPPIDGAGWQIEHIRPSQLGLALHDLMINYFNQNIDTILRQESPTDMPMGCLQVIVQPYFPEWKTILALPEVKFKAGTYTFKVSQGWTWRRVQLSARMTLEMLSDVILTAFDFDNDHIYYFTYTDDAGRRREVRHPDFDDGPWVSDIRIGDVPFKEGKAITFRYDLGRRWEFNIVLESIGPTDLYLTTPEILEIQGNAPEQYP